MALKYQGAKFQSCSPLTLDWVYQGSAKTASLSIYERYILYLLYLGITKGDVKAKLNISRTGLKRILNRIKIKIKGNRN